VLSLHLMSTDLQPPDRGKPAAQPAQAAEAVRAVARAFERDRYLTALLAPPSAREDLLTLAAFAGELARVPALVSNTLLGEMRLQWWRDVIDAGLAPGGGRSGHPVGDAVVEMLQRHGMPARALHDLIDAQAARLDDRPFLDMEALEANLVAWDGCLFRLSWLLLGGAGEAPPVLAMAGRTYGLARVLIEAPAELAQGRVLLPRTMLAAHGLDADASSRPLTREAFISPASPAATQERDGDDQRRQGWRTLLGELAARAEAQLNAAVPLFRRATRPVRLAALPLALVRPYLRVTRRVEVTELQAEDVTPLTRAWRLLLVSRTGRP
jgi:phytoene synthase